MIPNFENFLENYNKEEEETTDVIQFYNFSDIGNWFKLKNVTDEIWFQPSKFVEFLFKFLDSWRIFFKKLDRN